MYCSIMKKVFLLLILTGFILPLFAQQITYKDVSDEQLIYVLNNIQKHIGYKNNTGDVFINVYVVADPSGSAGIAGSDEITNTIYIATSGGGEQPKQYLFKLTPVLAPKFLGETRTEKDFQFTFAYGVGNKRENATVTVSLNDLKIK